MHVDPGLRALADECVMCGLCLPHCPTFGLSGLESRSPRGRIALAKDLGNASAADASIRDALESCLQCRACERVCPAQVRYGEIIEGARAALRGSGPTPAGAALYAAAHPRLAGTLLALAGRGARLWPRATRQLGRRARWLMRAGPAIDARADARAPSVLFGGCLSRAFDSESQHALLRVARAVGLDLRPLRDQGCCGALARHVGAASDADRQGERLGAQWQAAGTGEVVALDSGCIDALRRAAGQHVRIVEGCRWLLERRSEWMEGLRSLPGRVGWFAPCSHRNVVGDAAAARELLERLPGVEVVPIVAGHGCCGAAGPHLLAHPAQADALAQPVVDAIACLRLDEIATTNVGCALHLAERLALRGITLAVRHPVACFADRLPKPSP